MDVSPALLVDRVAQMQRGQGMQQAQIEVLKTAMDMQASASHALLNAVVGDLPLAAAGGKGTQVNVMV